MFVVDDLAAVLVEWLADASRKKITTLVMGTEQQRALKRVAKSAVEMTVNELCPEGGAAADLLNTTLSSALRDPQPLTSGVPRITLLESFHEQLAERIIRTTSSSPASAGAVVSADAETRIELDVVSRRLGGHVIDLILDDGIQGGPLAALAERMQHDAIYLQGKRIESKVEQVADEISQVLSFASRERAGTPLAVNLPPGRPIGEINAIDLGVHKAIRPNLTADEDLDISLPRYISRTHDVKLRRLLSGMRGAGAVFVVGESSCGKTRACYEAVAQSLPEWRVVQPYDASELMGYLRSDFAGPTVVWLDEAQDYLGDRRSKEIVIEIRRLLQRRDQNVIILGTMWPLYWRQFTGHKNQGRDLGAFSGLGDFSHVARLLELTTVHRVDVAGGFNLSDSSEVAQLSRWALADLRIDAALRTAGPQGKIIQVLAGGVMLLDNYLRLDDEFTRAVVTAAMDARRLGYHSVLPPGLLMEGAQGYLGASRQPGSAAEWFSDALQDATAEVHGISALTPARRRAGSAQSDGYVLHDYLDEYGRRARRGAVPPLSLWDALASWVTDPGDVARLHQAAMQRHLRWHAALTAAAGIRSGDSNAMVLFARSLREAGQQREADSLLVQAAEHGSATAVEQLIQEGRAAGSVNEAVSRLVSVAPGQDAIWYDSAVRSLESDELPAEILDAWRAEAAKRNSGAMRREAQRLHRAGKVKEAMSWWSSAIREGDEAAIEDAFTALRSVGRLNDALVLARWAADLAYTRAGIIAARALRDLGNLDEATAWYMWAGSAGDAYGVVNATSIMLDRGREREAINWLMGLGEKGNRHAIRRATELLVRRRGFAAAAKWLDPLARSGNLAAASCMARILLRAGQVSTSVAWWQFIIPRLPLPEPGHRVETSLDHGIYNGTVFLLDDPHGGDPLKVDENYRYGNSAQLRSAIAAHEKAGILEQMAALLTSRGESGDSDAVREAVRVFTLLGMRDEGVRWLESLAEHGDINAMRRLANLWASLGYFDAAADWWARIADHGVSFGAVRIARLCEGRGDLENSTRWWQKAVETATDVDRQIEWTQTVQTYMRQLGREAEILPCITVAVSR